MYLKRDRSSRCWLQEQLKSLAVQLWSLRTAAARNSRCRSSVRQGLQELHGSQAEAADSASCGGCRSSLSRLLWAFKMRAAALAARGSCCWLEQRASVAARIEGGGLQDQLQAGAARAAPVACFGRGMPNGRGHFAVNPNV